jgi:hypothetical protein
VLPAEAREVKARAIKGGTRVRKLMRDLKPYGIVASYTGGGHIRLERVDGIGSYVYTSSTPSRRGWEANVMDDLRRLGLVPRT